MENPALRPGMALLYEVRGAGPREVDLQPGAFVVVVEARNVRLDPVHGGRLEGRSGGGEPHRHGAPFEAPALDEPGRIGDHPGGKRFFENLVRKPVDLDDEEAPRQDFGRGSEPDPPGEAIHEPLERQDEMVDHRGAIVARRVKLLHAILTRGPSHPAWVPTRRPDPALSALPPRQAARAARHTAPGPDRRCPNGCR